VKPAGIAGEHARLDERATHSSMKNGFPAVRSMRSDFNGARLASAPRSAPSSSLALFSGKGSMRA
jgi:hypothetical protein